MRQFILHIAVLILLLPVAPATVFAQCEGCVAPADAPGTPSFCFKASVADARCAQFFQSDSLRFAYYPGKGKAIWLPLPASASLDAVMPVVKANSKLKGPDALFVQAAIATWYQVKLTLGFTFRPSGLAIKMIKSGTGSPAAMGQKVTCHYKMYLRNGKVIQDSRQSGVPVAAVMGAGQLLKGWEEGLMQMPRGSVATLRIPPELAFGNKPYGDLIPANSEIWIDLEVLNIE